MRLLMLIPLGHNVRSWSSGSGSRVHVHAYYVLHCGASPSWLLQQQIRRKQQRSQKAQPREADALQLRRKQKRRERVELQTLINYSGSSPRAEWPFSAHAQDLYAPISLPRAFFQSWAVILFFKEPWSWLFSNYMSNF